jgi:hypothetical protein
MTNLISPSYRQGLGPSPQTHIHEFNDWCHLCGCREDRTIDVWYPRNAENVTPDMETVYIRICSKCLGYLLSKFRDTRETRLVFLGQRLSDA